MSIIETVSLFTRYPVPGESKTRLIPELGPEGAAHMHRLMTQTLFTKLQKEDIAPSFRLEVCYTGGTLELMQAWLGTSVSYRKQPEGDIGNRMRVVMAAHHRQGRPVCIIGSDCPHITPAIIDEAFSTLKECNLVLGPSHDGGYYLIGCSPALDDKCIPILFRGILWGGSHVLSHTKKNIAAAGEKCHLLQTLHDIDTPEDLRYFGYHPDVQ